MIALERLEDRLVWNHILSDFSSAHILQTWEWGHIKSSYGWQPFPYVWRDRSGNVRAMALILRRPLRLGRYVTPLSVMYVPRGPVMDWADTTLRRQVLKDLHRLARMQGAIFIKIDPDLEAGGGILGTPEAWNNPTAEETLQDLRMEGWCFSAEQVQFRNTFVLLLDGEEETWLARMKQKTRYNIRLAQRKGVLVRRALLEDLPVLYRMYAETSVRDGFVIRPEAYYQQVWKTFMESGMAELLIAEVEGVPVAGLVMLVFAHRAWYFYGMSRELHRDKMPNYLLQWEAMRLAHARGCRVYDLWGAPDEFREDDPMWGVFRFKQGLGGQVIRWIGAWDLPVRRQWYTLYTRIIPRLLAWMRRRTQDKLRREVTA
ncbi:peptidoglycan bridge formation glycyltransferase FemA/FemB family protein [uncultured Thermanaerothrix sp.]|uniref:lipid II:glycine glycyltransferase FemX n=1 Tax=uncultured Thermanaerothrix sp. TaxID=1195149 RepID=UPI00260BCABC|nr:peptidoglycan bridge formation glycyltransferase FemA/FemB family protein [uncultured Thermanaerothrix sp.]